MNRGIAKQLALDQRLGNGGAVNPLRKAHWVGVSLWYGMGKHLWPVPLSP
jgi:hypothetical protein